MSYLIEIQNDVLNIVKQIKNINKSYKIFYNAKLRRFEVHSVGLLRTNTEVVGAESLDKRLYYKTLQTRKENMERLIGEMEMLNERLEQAEIKAKLEKTSTLAQEILKYGNKDTTLKDIVKENT